MTQSIFDERWARYGREHRMRAVDEIALNGFHFSAPLPAAAGHCLQKRKKKKRTLVVPVVCASKNQLDS